MHEQDKLLGTEGAVPRLCVLSQEKAQVVPMCTGPLRTVCLPLGRGEGRGPWGRAWGGATCTWWPQANVLGSCLPAAKRISVRLSLSPSGVPQRLW